MCRRRWPSRWLILFAAIFSVGGAPIDLPAALVGRKGAPAGKFERPGGSDRVAFLCPDPAQPTVERDHCSMHVLGGRFWIVGRIRLDARRELVARLAHRIEEAAESLPDGLLCLHAYAAWGDRFVEALAGDFSFALWDAERGCLLAVRDQMGVRTLFHATAGGFWFISDSLDWLARRRPVARTLDDYWIADFLTLGHCREFERTVYRDIRRLAPGRLLRVSDQGVSLGPYWNLNIAEPVFFKDPETYGERFRELLARAIEDRLPAGDVGISMSGGLDSTTLAASAAGVVAGASRVVAECEIREDFAELEEDRFASIAARYLGVDLHVRSISSLVYDPHWRSRAIRSDEPTELIVRAHWIGRTGRERAGRAKVWFYGEGPDNALRLDRDAYFGWLYRHREWRKLGAAFLQYARAKGVGGWLGTARRHIGRQEQTPVRNQMEPWLSEDFSHRLKLRERARTLGEGGAPHPWHPAAIASFTSPTWQAMFDGFNFEESLAPIVWRHPYLDLRVLEFMLSVPPVPWGWNKQLLRRAMEGQLPAEILARPKGAPGLATAPLPGGNEMPQLEATDLLATYVNIGKLPAKDASRADIEMALSAHALDYWLAATRS